MFTNPESRFMTTFCKKKLTHRIFKQKRVLVTAYVLLALVTVAMPAYPEEDVLYLMDPEYSECGNVLINGVVSIDPSAFGLVWDWGDGSKTTSWFPATHRYATNGNFTVTVTATACNTLTETTTAQVINSEDPNCPPTSSRTFYHLLPYSMHLTEGETSTDPLHVVDQDGNPVSGTPVFTTSDPQDLVSISQSGFVTALRAENTANDIGVWVNATLDGGLIVSNNCVVRVLPPEYVIPDFAEALGERTRLYYPTSVNGQDIAALVNQFEIPIVNEYARQIESRLMGTNPFSGGRQIFEVDLGITETNRVCGISGNPIRLGWNAGGDSWNPWQNCFLVPFPVWNPPPPLSPQWGVFYHELGHNMTWASFIFATCLDHYLYSEGLATAMGLAVMEEILSDSGKYPIGNDAFFSLQWINNRDVANFTTARQQWLDGGAAFSAVDPDIVDGIFIHHKTGVPNFADRFFLPLQPLMIEYLDVVLCQVQAGGENTKHTFFAALMSAAAGADLYTWFADTYNYPLIQSLYDQAYAAFTGIIAQRECPGDFGKDGSSDDADLAVFAADFGKTGCTGVSCNGDFNSDGDVDGSELVAFILKFGRTDCL